MDDMWNDDETINRSSNQKAQPEISDWVPRTLVEDLLFNSIQEDGSASSADDVEFEEIDDSIDGDDEYEDEEEERHSAYRLLSEMRPQLSELLAKNQD